MSKEHTMAERLQQLTEAREKVEAGGGVDKLDKQRAKGKLTARDRIDALIDEGTFQETGAFRRNRTRDRSAWRAEPSPPPGSRYGASGAGENGPDPAEAEFEPAPSS